MDLADLKMEVDEMIATLYSDGDRKGLTKFVEALDGFKTSAENSLASLGLADEDEDWYGDDEDRFIPDLDEDVDDGEDDGSDLGDGVECE